MTIDKNLKEEFVEFCETKNEELDKYGKPKNGNKIFKSNLMRKDWKWFYVQVGNIFEDYLHIEYTNSNAHPRLQFHIEFDTIEENEGFYDLLKKLEPSITQYLTPVQNKKDYENYLWFDIKNTTNITTKDDLFNEFTTYIEKLDSAISKIEKLYHK